MYYFVAITNSFFLTDLLTWKKKLPVESDIYRILKEQHSDPEFILFSRVADPDLV